MIPIVLIIFTLTFSLDIFGQQLDGKFSQDSDFIAFEKDSVDFKISSNGGLIVDLYGNGVYKIADDFLLIETCDFKGTVSSHEKIKNEDKLIHFIILDSDNKAVPGVNIILNDKDGNFISGTLTNKNGYSSIEKNKNADRINISLVGYDNYSLKYSGLHDYRVNLVNYKPIENRTVVFKINALDSLFLDLTLLSTDFAERTGRKSELEKLDTKSIKSNYRNRKLTKE